MTLMTASALETSAAVQSGQVSAREIVDGALSTIRANDGAINSFTLIAEASARTAAAEIDSRRSKGLSLGPLAGVPFAAKDLFDVKGEITTAGAKLRSTAAKATSDASLIARMKEAGAV